MYGFGKLKLKVPSFGLEYAGYMGSDPNDRNNWVMGFGSEGCIAKKVLPELFWKVPEYMDLEQAVTIPVVYSTVYYALFEKARLQPGDTILIHVGAGGIGNAALTVCLKRGINVFTTCSSKKRQFLKDKFGLTDQQIGDSRSPSFRDLVMEQTKGRGVDCVLNSLSGEMLDASLDVVKPHGHFCEIGKYDLMNDTKIGIRCFAENVSYHAIDLTPMIKDPVLRDVLFDLVQNGLEKQEIEPLPVKTFGMDRVEEALRFMSGGHHRGKVTLDMVNCSKKNIVIKNRFITSGTHIVTGGLGGFGLELAVWLEGCGADTIVLTSRSGIKDGWQRRRYEQLQKKMGKNLIISHLNVVDITESQKLIQLFGDDIKGIWHVAMVLQDTLFENMTDKQWDLCVSTKQIAFQNLSEATRDLDLDVFCGFSSISSLMGNVGQSNYSYGNCAMESLIVDRSKHRDEENKMYRSKKDLVIQWGAIGNVGFVSKNFVGDDSMELDMEVEVQNIDLCLDNIHHMLGSEEPVISSYLKKRETVDTNTTTFREWILNLLGVEEEKANKSWTFSDLGMDSLQTVEVKNKLSKYGVEKTTKEISGMTIGDIWDI